MMSIHGKQLLKAIRSVGTFWSAEQTLEHLKALRAYELDVVCKLIPHRGRLLEIGAGTGWQAQALENHGFDVSAIELVSSNYSNNRVRSIVDYDGHTIPFLDNTFDVIFSSNVLEHIFHIHSFQKEIHRVLKPDGYVVHVLPSSSWRLCTIMTGILKTWRLPGVHGEHSKNAIAEIKNFSRQVWIQFFQNTDWELVSLNGTKLFYTGYSLMDSRLNINIRHKLSYIFGSACNIYILRKQIH